jgi:gliding motility-associatede transport system auxiliary component
MKINRPEIFKAAGLLGVTLLAVGYVRYSVEEVLGTLNLILLIAGGLMLVVSLGVNFRAVQSYSKRRSARLGTNTIVMTVAVVAIVGLLNFLGYRHHKRIDLTAEKLYSLSDQTRKITSELQKDVKVIQFDKADDQGIGDLVKEYRDLSSRISYERVDPQAKPELARQYKITRLGEVIVTSGNRTERPEEINEQTLTNAIIKATRDTMKVIYFVEGHGERQITSMDKAEGYGVVNQWLKNENYETRSVSLVGASQVPSDCEVLVVAGPKQPLFPQEASMIGKYLDEGGKALLLVDPDTDPRIADVLKVWNIELGDDAVIDVKGVRSSPDAGLRARFPVAASYGAHAITKDFGNILTFFPNARSVNVSTGAGINVSTTELLKTSNESWAETEAKAGDPEFNEGKDKKGPVSMGIAASKPVGDNEARLVVIGDSDFTQNSFAQYNGDLFMNSINWLAQDEDLISIRAKDPTSRSVTMTASQQNLLFWLTLVLMPGAAVASGVYIWWKRR